MEFYRITISYCPEVHPILPCISTPQWRNWLAHGTYKTVVVSDAGVGDDGFEKHMDRLMELTEYMVKRIREQPDKFYLILEPELVNVCFWYIPTRLRKIAHSPAREQELGKMCPVLKARMMQSGTLMVGYQPDDRRPNYFRNIISSAAVTEQDVDFLLSEMDRLGHDL
ncbi:hypothetical protein WA026_017978 [Henosepilachna vigintioctopunctata]|uniref:Glutamate decarboxylase n=1 Tax=Henosepilachna vigintioctopunctata TaxID=420089 RepID=A0AAW1TQ99_9CUCU